VLFELVVWVIVNTEVFLGLEVGVRVDASRRDINASIWSSIARRSSRVL
jgi:hypothetical protein